MSSDQKDLKLAHQKFTEDLKKKGRSVSTILAYDNDTKQLVEFLQRKKISQATSVNSEQIEEFIKLLFDEGYTAKSVSRKLNSIKAFFRFLKAENFISQDPAEDIPHPKFEAKPPRILSKMEYRALRDASRDNPRLSAIIELLLQTGMRIGELGRLENNDVSDKEIKIKAYESHFSREVPLNQSAKKAIERYLENRPKTKTKIIFVTRPGRPFLVRNIRTAIDRYFRLAGIKNAKVNSLRHTFIAHQLQSGAPVTLVQKLVGHKRLSTTEKYLSLIEDKGEETVRLEEL
ncbi:tyrosine-type recombinase/integrase [Patescibacteria group bacterium]